MGVAEWMSPPLVPLGDPHTGECVARPQEAWQPRIAAQRDWCNMGYARGLCPRMPEEGPDAVRFAVAADSGGRIRLLYALEREHEPFNQGQLEYVVAAARIEAEDGGATLARQAEAYLASYFRRKPR